MVQNCGAGIEAWDEVRAPRSSKTGLVPFWHGFAQLSCALFAGLRPGESLDRPAPKYWMIRAIRGRCQSPGPRSRRLPCFRGLFGPSAQFPELPRVALHEGAARASHLGRPAGAVTERSARTRPPALSMLTPRLP